MAEEAGSRAGDEAGSVFNRSVPASATTFDEASFGVFKEGLGDLGKDTALEPIKTHEAMVKSFIESQKMLGASIRLPGKDLSPEDKGKAVGEIKGKLVEAGILESFPEAFDKYDIQMPQIEGWSVNQPLYDGFRKAAHASGITSSQAQRMFDWYVNYEEESTRQEEAEFKVMKENLKTEWGALYVRRMEAARRAIVKYVGTEGDALISSLPPKTGEMMVKAFALIGDPLLEDDFTVGEIATGIATKEGLQEKINEMWNDKKGPLNDESHPGHKAAVEEHTRLQRALAALTAPVQR